MGKVYLVGAGPGDKDLITVKGLRLLSQCDVVIYDRLATEELLAHVKPSCKKIYVGKQAGYHSMKQEEINRILVESAGEFDLVVRLKGGDSFVFGRGGEEVEELLKHDIYFEVIPGITSAIGVPEVAGIPVTHRGTSQSFHVITGHRTKGNDIPSEQYEVLAKLEGTLVFLMGLSNIGKIVKGLLTYGKCKETPVAVISNGTTIRERSIRGNLETIEEKISMDPLESPGIIVIGETAAYHYLCEKKNICNQKNIVGKKVIGLIGTTGIREKLGQQLLRNQYQVVNLLDMKVIETDQYENEFLENLQHIEEYKWVLFTSQNGVHLFFQGMKQEQIDFRRLGKLKFAVIGSGTKGTLSQYGFEADFMPKVYTSKELAIEFLAIVRQGEKVLLPRAKQGSEGFTEQFVLKGIDMIDIPIYDVIGNSTGEINQESIDRIDCFAFASASGVVAFFDEIRKRSITLPTHVIVACIGEVTAKAVEGYEVPATIIGQINDINGLVEQINQYFILV